MENSTPKIGVFYMVNKFGSCSSTSSTHRFSKNDYPHFEKYDDSKDYPIGAFETDYGYGLQKYKYTAFSIRPENPEMDNEYWVALEEVIDEAKQEEFGEFCQCEVCVDDRDIRNNSYMSYLWNYLFPRTKRCRCCYGCLLSSRPSSVVLQKARRLKAQGL
jgi:hypothetical protein